MNEDDESVRQALVAELALLREDGAAFTVAEFGVNDIVVWKVHRDGNGTPQARRWPPVSPPPWTDPRLFYEQKLSPLIGAESRLFIVRNSADHRPEMFDAVRTVRRDAPVHRCAAPMEILLREAIRDSPLTRWYELVVLTQTRTGRLGLDSHQLFPPEAARGYSQQLRIRCEPSDDHGTVFAVVTRESRHFRPVSVQSAMVPPGVYKLTALLSRPGHVQFDGLPAELRPDSRNWQAIVDAVPARLERRPPTHLICAIEVSGTNEQVRRRISRLEQLIDSIGSGGQMSVSLISYGPHAFDRHEHEEPVTVLAWAAATEYARSALLALGDHRQPEDEYPRAAQLECVLTEIADRLPDQHGRPVLVTIGSRPPFPPRMDLRTEIIPCPHRRDWQRALRQICAVPGIALGAIYDKDAHGDIWPLLGREALESVDLLDVPGFAQDLGLCAPVQHMPFPTIEQEGT